jgi:nicotinamidase-related amidase
MKALVIIDVQANLFLEPKAEDIETVAARLDGIAADARAAGVPVVFVRHDEAGTPWERDTAGWAFHPTLAPKPEDIVVDKQSCDGFRNTRLATELARLGADQIIVGGYASEFCIDTTVRAAASREIGVTIIADGHTTRDRPHVRAATTRAHLNWLWPEMSNPGNPIRVVPAAALDWRA